MRDRDKTKKQLLSELMDLRRRIDALEGLDIKRKQVEEALRLSDALNFALFEYNPIETVVVDLEGRIVGFNLAKRKSNSRLPSMGDVMYKDYARNHVIDMYSELMGCIKLGETKRFPEQKYNDKILSITISPFFNGAIITSEDITERKQAEEALHSSEERFRDLYENAPIAYFSVGVDGLIKRCNKLAEELLGFTKEKLLGRPVFGLYADTPQGKKKASKVFERFQTGEMIIDEELQMQDTAGKPVWISLTVNAVRDEHGRVAESRSMVVDITERKRSEEALRESEEKFRNLIENTSDWVWEVDIEGRYVYCSPRVFDLTGYTVGEILDKTPFDFMPEEESQRMRETFLHIAEKREAFRLLENTFVHKDGHSMILETNGVPVFDEQGRLLGYRGVDRDITERKQAEEALRDREHYLKIIFNSVQAGMVVIDAQTHSIVDANHKAIEMIGAERSQTIGSICHEFICPAERGKCPITDLGQNVDSSERTLVVAGGQRIPILKTVAPVILGGRTYLLENFFDISERKRSEEALLKAKKLESVGILAGGIAHDFNNLLTSILGNISFAKMHGNPEDKIFKLLDHAEKASIRASELTKQLITFSKGGVPVKKMAPIGELLEDTAHLSLSGSNVSCRFNIPNDLWPVEIDEGQMRQVIHHIVRNAREAMPEGGVINLLAQNMTLSAKDGLPLKGGKYIKLSVEDHGVGIPQENLSKIFDPYFTTKEMGSQKGMGLGLAICYSVIKNHEGLITVESRVGVGTTFHIYLPVSREAVMLKKEIMQKPLRGQGRVLVMDDEEGVREVTGETLRYMGYEIEFAEEGAEAIEQYKKAKETQQVFDVVILDLTVRGGMGGKEAIRKLVEIDPGVKAIVTSGYSDDPIMFEFERYGFKGALAKPYKIEKLIETVSRVMGKVS